MRHKSIKSRLKWALMLFLWVLPPVHGCDNDRAISPSDDIYYTSISRDVTVVPETGAFYLHHIDGEEYIFFCWREEIGIKKDRFLAGTGFGGYLRRIDDVRREGDFYHVLTSPVLLTDVYRRGWIDATFAGGTGSSGGGRIDLSGTDLYLTAGPTGGRGVGIEEGYIGFNPDISVRIGVIAREVREMTVTVDGALELYSSIIADIDSDFELDSTLESASFSSRQILYCGSLPVVMDIDVSFIVSISGSGGYCDSCRYALRSHGKVSTGAEYLNGSWTVSDESGLHFSATPLACSDYADGQIAIDLAPRISISIYGVPAFTIKASQTQSVSSSTEVLPDWAWDISGGLCNDFTFEDGILGGGVPPFEGRGICESNTLRSGPYRTDDYIFVTGWGSEGTGDHEFLFPSGIAAGPDGSIYVCDRTANRVSRFSPDSTFIDSWGGQGTGEGQFNFPAGIASGPTGDIFVVDKGNRRIQRFDSDGSFILSWGSHGDGEGQFRQPEGIAVSGEGIVLVTDNLANRVQSFSADGIFAGSWGSTGSAAGQLSGPMGITLDDDGYIYVSECYNNRVQKFTPEGTPILSWGSPGSGDGLFACPSGISAGPDGFIYVSDYGNDRVQVFGAGGTFIASFGQGEFDKPYGLVVYPSGDIFVTDSGNYRVQRYSPLD